MNNTETSPRPEIEACIKCGRHFTDRIAPYALLDGWCIKCTDDERIKHEIAAADRLEAIEELEQGIKDGKSFAENGNGEWVPMARFVAVEKTCKKLSEDLANCQRKNERLHDGFCEVVEERNQLRQRAAAGLHTVTCGSIEGRIEAVRGSVVALQMDRDELMSRVDRLESVCVRGA